MAHSMDRETVPGSAGFAIICALVGVLVALAMVALLTAVEEETSIAPRPVLEQRQGQGLGQPIVDFEVSRGTFLPDRPEGRFLELGPRAPFIDPD